MPKNNRKPTRVKTAKAKPHCAPVPGSGHVEHNLHLFPTSVTTITLGGLLQSAKIIKIPDNAILRCANGNGWTNIKNLSFCRSTGEISLW